MNHDNKETIKLMLRFFFSFTTQFSDSHTQIAYICVCSAGVFDGQLLTCRKKNIKNSIALSYYGLAYVWEWMIEFKFKC